MPQAIRNRSQPAVDCNLDSFHHFLSDPLPVCVTSPYLTLLVSCSSGSFDHLSLSLGMKFPISSIKVIGPHLEQNLLANLLFQCLPVRHEESCSFCVNLEEDATHVHESHDESPRAEVDAQVQIDEQDTDIGHQIQDADAGVRGVVVNFVPSVRLGDANGTGDTAEDDLHHMSRVFRSHVEVRDRHDGFAAGRDDEIGRLIRDDMPREVQQSVSERCVTDDILMDGKPKIVVKGRRRMYDEVFLRESQ
jgi:hypothetical protein